MADNEVTEETLYKPAGPIKLTRRSFIMGSLLAVFLCAMNSYLTLSFGVIEEGPTIAALFFFAFFFWSQNAITTTELVVVATMGSAGGSLGFITNFYAAKAMTGTAYTFWEMTAFAIVTSLIGLVFVIPLRELLVVRDKLPWPGSKATASVISALVHESDKKQPLYLLFSIFVAGTYVLLNTDGGFGILPDGTEIGLFGLSAYGAAIYWSPFAIGGAYLMGFRTCVGFLVGGLTLLVMAPYLPEDYVAAPNRYVWPGIAFLVASGITVMIVNWRVISGSMLSLFSRRAVGVVDTDRIISPAALMVLASSSLLLTIAFLTMNQGLGVGLILMLVVVGGFVQNVIATRAAAQTAFNPARVMGVLLQGLSALMGGASASANLTGAGFVAGSGAQAGNLTGDLAYGRWYKVPSRWQFWTQFTTLIPCALVSAYVFKLIRETHVLAIDSESLAAPVAKIWATSALIFEGKVPMPAGATTAMIVGAIAGVVWVLLEANKKIEPYIPSSVGLGLGLVLPIGYDFAFFLGGVILWLVCRRGFRVSDMTLTTVAVGCIVAEGLGGVIKPILKILHLI